MNNLFYELHLSVNLAFLLIIFNRFTIIKYKNLILDLNSIIK